MNDERFAAIGVLFRDKNLVNALRQELENLFLELSAEGAFDQKHSDTIRQWIPAVKHFIDVAWVKERDLISADSQKRHLRWTYILNGISILIALGALIVSLYKKPSTIQYPVEVRIIDAPKDGNLPIPPPPKLGVQ